MRVHHYCLYMTIFNICAHGAVLTQSSNSFTFFTSCPQKMECYLELESPSYAFSYVLDAPSVVPNAENMFQ